MVAIWTARGISWSSSILALSVRVEVAKVMAAASSPAAIVTSLEKTPDASLQAMRTPSVILPKVSATRPAPPAASRTPWFTHFHSPSASS